MSDDDDFYVPFDNLPAVRCAAMADGGRMPGHRRSQMIITDPQPTEESTTGGGGGVAANDESSDAEFSSIVAPKLLIALLREKERCALESLLTFARPTSTAAPPPPQQDPSSIASAKKRAAALIKSISRHARENRPIPIAPNSSAAGASPQLLYFPNAYVEALIVNLCPDCHKLAAEADASRQSRNKKKRRRHPSVSASSSSLSDSGSGGDEDGSSSASSSSASSSSNTAKRVLKERRRLLKAKERRKRQRDGSDNGDSGSDSDDSAGRKIVIEEKTLEHARRENALRCAAHKRSIAESLPQCNDHVHPLPTPLFLQAEGGLSMLLPSHVVWHEIKEARKMLGDVASFANEVFEEIAPAHNAPTSPSRRKGRRGEYPHHNAATPPPLSGENQLQQSYDGNAKHASLLEDVSDLFGENNSLATDLVATSLSGHARGMPVLEDGSSVHMYLEVLSERLKLLAESGAINASILLRSPTQSDFTSLDGTFLNCAPLLSNAIRLLCKRSANSPSDAQTRAKRKVAASSFEETPMTLHHESLLLSFLATRFLNQGHTSSAPSTIGRKSEELLGSSVAAQICFAIRARLRRSWVSSPSSRHHSHQHLIVSCETSLISIFLSLFESFLRFCEHEVAVLVASEVKWDHFSRETACDKKEPTAHFIWRTTDTIMSQLPVLSAMSVIFSNFIVAHADGMASAARQCAKHVISFLDSMMTDAASSAILAALLTFWSPTAPSGDHCDKENGREQDLLLLRGSSREGSKETADHSVEAFNHDSIPETSALLPRFFYLLEGIELDRDENTIDEQTCKGMPQHTETLRILTARMGNILGSKSTFRAALLNKATAKTISASGRDADGTKRDTKANKMNSNPEEQYDWVLEQHDKHENHYFRDDHPTHSLDVAMLYSYRTAVSAPNLGANAASALDIKSAARELYESKKNLTQAREHCTHLRVQLQQQLDSVVALLRDLGDAAQSATNAEQTFVAATLKIATQECISSETAMRMKALQATFAKSKEGTHSTKKPTRKRK